MNEPEKQAAESADKLQSRISNAKQVRGRAMERLEAQDRDGVGPAETVTLPSGLVFLMRRPRPLWWVLEGRLPSSLAAKLAGDSGLATRDSGKPEEIIELSRWVIALLEETVIEPKIRLKPGPKEVDPNWISEEDLLFIIRYAGGEVQADGRDLSSFPGVGESAAAGAGGADLELPAVPNAGNRGNDGIAD
jgi:hypothetical protein